MELINRTNRLLMPILATLLCVTAAGSLSGSGIAQAGQKNLQVLEQSTASHSCCPRTPQERLLPSNDAQSRENADSDTNADTHIWEWMRDGFAMPRVKQERVRRYLREYTRHPSLLVQVLRRGEPYFYHILKRLEQHSMPAELALLPVIESAFDPFATSPVGAAGIWQFMPATAEDNGLDQNWWYDGRRDIIASTDAAIDYLHRLNEDFDGDWFLTMAAYNAGKARVRQAIRRNREAGKPVDFWHLPLPEETQSYVPRLIALRTIIEHPGDFNVSLPEFPATRYFSSIEIRGQIELAVAARLAGVSLAQLQLLNPGYDRSITPPVKVCTLLVPATTAHSVGDRIAQLPKEQRIRSIRHQIRPGDNLSTIAQRYRTTVSALRRVNRLDGSKIIAGDVLMIPIDEEAQAAAEDRYASLL